MLDHTLDMSHRDMSSFRVLSLTMSRVEKEKVMLGAEAEAMKEKTMLNAPDIMLEDQLPVHQD